MQRAPERLGSLGPSNCGTRGSSRASEVETRRQGRGVMLVGGEAWMSRCEKALRVKSAAATAKWASEHQEVDAKGPTSGSMWFLVVLRCGVVAILHFCVEDRFRDQFQELRGPGVVRALEWIKCLPKTPILIPFKVLLSNTLVCSDFLRWQVWIQ